MWEYNSDYNVWKMRNDRLEDDYVDPDNPFSDFVIDYQYYLQELSLVRFYSKALSGATYLPVNNFNNIYDVLGSYKPRNWYISIDGSQYTNTLIPSFAAEPINGTTSVNYYQKFLSEYGLSLKTLFTPKRLLDDAAKNYLEVDVATTAQIDGIGFKIGTLTIDGIVLKEGHRVLVKNQKDTIVLPNTIDPNTYFLGSYIILRNLGTTIEYEFFTSENGIYQVRNNILVRTRDLYNYEDCVRYSVVVKLGTTNINRQFHLTRLRNGYFPVDIQNEPFEFEEKKNWMLRNKVNYNNLFEINHYDILKHGTQSYTLQGVTYSIPERTITVGEFGTIICNQVGISNLVSNKYKVNLRSISQTSKYYWICGDTGILLKVRKHDFLIEKINLQLDNKYSINLRSISFFSDLRGVVVGDLNTIYLTTDSGANWKRLRIKDFDPFYYTKVIFNKANNFTIGGKNGIFIEFRESISGWTAYRRRISKIIDDDDDHLLVDNINDLFYTNISTWNLNFQYFTQSIPLDKELIFITTDDSKLIVYDINKTNGLFDFIYLDLGEDYGDIMNIYRRENTNDFYYTGMKISTADSGVFNFDISNFTSIGVGNSYSNTIAYTSSTPQFITSYFPNELFDYGGNELLMCGNESLLKIGTYSLGLNFVNPDDTFVNRLKSKFLFLDYDAASKLNFFTDFGDYRLPNQLTFRGNSFSSSSELYFEPLVYYPEFPDYMTQSETNWWTYWTDVEKTFEFYDNTNPLDESSMVLMSSTFSYSPTQSEYTITKITNTASVISFLAPQITEPGHSRFNAMGMTAISDPLTIDELYIYKYLMIFKTTDFSYPVKVGDVMRFSSSYIEGNFVVNKILNLATGKYIYMFTEFNDTIITNLKGLTASIKNLNSYTDLDELETKFNLHPISKAYHLRSSYEEEITSISLTPLIGETYSNWSIQSLTESSNFTVIGFTTSSANSLQISPSSGSGAQTASIITPEIDGVTNISFSYDYQFGTYAVAGSYSSISVLGLSASTWYEIATYSIPTSLVVSTPQNVDFTFLGTYSQFRFDFTVVERDPVISGYMWISIQDIKLYSSTYITTDPFNYGVTYSNNRFVSLLPQFNNYTSYYNLSTNVFLNGDKFTMSYTEGFLDFKYTPTYNILSYLEGLNDVGYPNPKFTADKEYFAMPDFRGIPMSGNGINIATNSVVYLSSNGITYSNYFNPIQETSNRIRFGKDLALEWESIFINTFVDVSLWNYTPYVSGAPSSTTERLLVLNKYFDEENELYVIEFHKNLNYVIGDFHYFIDITSRRTLKQISDDLQELNNIQQARLQKREPLRNAPKGAFYSGQQYYNYERELNFKIPTDSYAKVLLSDADTFQSLSAIMYIDYKNEMSMNILNLEEEVTIPISNTGNFAGNLFIFCSEKHGLKTNDSVVLEFNGGTFSSAQINQNYFGYHPVIVVNEYNFYLNLPYGSVPLGGNDTGFVKYSKQDPFLEFSPVDLIDIGINKLGKQSIELNVENQLLSKRTYSLINIDLNKYRFRLIDGLDINQVYEKYSWLLEAEISDAIIGQANGIIWYKGVWESGRWFGGLWVSGQWISGDWYGGTWLSRNIQDKVTEVKYDSISSPTASTWYNGRWFEGTWQQGLWVDGRWYGGTWSNGNWYRGIWNDGTWNQGRFGGGVWILGTWNDGVFNTDNEPSFWVDGEWNGGDFENGIWYNGTWKQAEGKKSRFGVNSYSSRTSIWHSGDWYDGEFHSRLNLKQDFTNDNPGDPSSAVTFTTGEPDVSDVHKYSIWYTGNWYDGDFYGGIAYNMNWKNGTWHGGILEDIQLIGFGNDGIGAYYLTLNGIFKFNIGDEFTIIDNNSGVPLSNTFGSNSKPKVFKVLYKEEDTVNKWTKVYVATSFSTNVVAPVDLHLRIVSRFANCNWKSGIWTNGIYKKGLWEGGIWYNGIFEATWM